MKLVHFVFVLLALSFFPFLEGILRRRSPWARLADAIDYSAIKVVTWRSRSGITQELPLLERHFLVLAATAFGLVIFSLKSPILFIWASLVFFVTFFAWVAFRWSFNEREAARQLAPILGYSLIPPWIFLLVAYAGPKMGLFTATAERLWFLKYAPYTPLEMAFYMYLAVAGLLVGYYLFTWFVFQPFAYAVLVGLKLSRTLAERVNRRTRPEMLFFASAAIQGLGLLYLYWISRRY